MQIADSFFLTPSEAASLLKVSRDTVYGLVESGEIPAVRVGGQWRIPREKLMASLEGLSAAEAAS